MAQNANLQAAQARLRQSQQNLRAGYGVFFPQISGNFQATRQRFTAAEFGVSQAPGSTFNLFTTQVTVSYLVDLFGG